MTIGRKLYLNFGAMLAMVVVLFLVNLVAVQREHTAKSAAAQSLGMAEATDAVRFQMMQNRLFLGNYLLSGDTREIDRLTEGATKLENLLRQARSRANSDQQRAPLDQVDRSEHSWNADFAAPLVLKRKDVDAG